MKRGPSGRYVVISRVGGETVRAFVPHPLPPHPRLDETPDLQERHDRALLALGASRQRIDLAA